MNQATFKALSYSIGLTPTDLARRLNTDNATVFSWFTTGSPPREAVEHLEKLIQKVAAFVDSELERIEEQPRTATVVVTAYRTQQSYQLVFGSSPALPWSTYESAIQQILLTAYLDDRNVTVEHVREEPAP